MDFREVIASRRSIRAFRSDPVEEDKLEAGLLAPIALGVCAIPGQSWSRRDGKNYADVDAAIVMDHMILAAASLGLGTCWIGNFYPIAAREAFKLESGWEPLALTPLGYPAEAPAARKRKSIADCVIRL